MSKLNRAYIEVKNGVRVKVTRTEKGSVVEAGCLCFGHPKRLHSRVDCPNIRRKLK